ncbi:MAG: FxsA family protein [Actinobacteria bacterium]|nr:FxsA family protein [Actinomycetota bacterium]
MVLLALLAIFIVVPIAEIYVILKVGEAIGVAWTIVLLMADAVLGSLLMRSQGRAVWRRFNDAVRAGRVPHSEVIDGVLVIFGGAFLIAPGFLTDVVGALLLLPPSRALVRRGMRRWIERRAGLGVVRAMRRRPPDRGRPATDGWDVEGTATEVDRETPRLRR